MEYGEVSAQASSGTWPGRWLWLIALLVVGALLVAVAPTLAQAASRNLDSARSVGLLLDGDPDTRPTTANPYLAGLAALEAGEDAEAAVRLAEASPADTKAACHMRLLLYGRNASWVEAAALPEACNVPEQFDRFLELVTRAWQPPAADEVDAIDAVLALASGPGLATAAATLASSSHFAEAERLARAALGTGENDAALLTLGRSLYAQNKFDEAREELARYVERQPSDPSGWYWLARAQVGIGRHDLAVDSFGQALEQSGPDDARRVYYFNLMAASQARLGACDNARASLAAAEKLTVDGDDALLASVGGLIRSLCP